MTPTISLGIWHLGILTPILPLSVLTECSIHVFHLAFSFLTQFLAIYVAVSVMALTIVIIPVKSLGPASSQSKRRLRFHKQPTLWVNALPISFLNGLYYIHLKYNPHFQHGNGCIRASYYLPCFHKLHWKSHEWIKNSPTSLLLIDHLLIYFTSLHDGQTEKHSWLFVAYQSSVLCRTYMSSKHLLMFLPSTVWFVYVSTKQDLSRLASQHHRNLNPSKSRNWWWLGIQCGSCHNHCNLKERLVAGQSPLTQDLDRWSMASLASVHRQDSEIEIHSNNTDSTQSESAGNLSPEMLAFLKI